MISWFFSTLASVGGIAEYATVHLQRLEDAGNTSFGEFTNTLWPWRNSSKAIFCWGRRLSRSNCSFIVYCTKKKKLFANFLLLTCLTCTEPSRTCTPIVRRVRNSPIRNALIYPCDSAGCQNEFLCTNSRMDYINSRWCMGRAAMQTMQT